MLLHLKPKSYSAQEAFAALQRALSGKLDIPYFQLVTVNNQSSLVITYSPGQQRIFDARDGKFNQADIVQIIRCLVPESLQPDIQHQVTDFLNPDFIEAIRIASRPGGNPPLRLAASATVREARIQPQRTLGDALAEMMRLPASAVEHHQLQTVSSKYCELVQALGRDSMNVVANIGLVMGRDPLSVTCDEFVARVNGKCPSQEFLFEQFLGLILEPNTAFQLIRQDGQKVLQPVKALRLFAQAFDIRPEEIFPFERPVARVVAASPDRGGVRHMIQTRRLVPT